MTMPARLFVKSYSENEIGITISEDVLDIIEDIVKESSAIFIEEISKLQKENSNLKLNQLKKCIICQDSVAQYMWSSCFQTSFSKVAHLCACSECIAKDKMKFCPLCRASDGYWLKVDARD